MSEAVAAYDREAARLAELYESLPFERVHAGLWRFGDLEVPRHVWSAVRHLNVWIEPISAGEWARLMQA